MGGRRLTAFLFGICLGVTSLGWAQIVTDGLVGYWPLDKGTIEGKTVKDVWGGNDGTIIGDPKSVPGKVGEALEFDGDDGIEIQGTEDLNFAGKNELTVMAWVMVGSDDPVVGVVPKCCGEIVAQRDMNGWCLRYDGRNGGQEMEFIVHSPAGWEGDGGFGVPLFKEGEWHHLAGVVDKDRMLLYLDGQLANEMPFTGGSIASTGFKTEIGKASDGGFIGLIDEVMIYSRALSAEEIEQNFQAKGLDVNPVGKLAAIWGEVKSEILR